MEDDATAPNLVAIPAQVTPVRRLLNIRWRSKCESIAIPVGAVIVSLVFFGLFLLAVGADPLAVFASMKKAAFGSWYSFQNTLVRAAPLMLCSLCTAIPFRLGLVVIGNEGALVVGGLCATAVGLQIDGTSALTIQIAMGATGMLAGGLWILTVGALKQYRGVTEMISSLLMNYLAIALLNRRSTHG
jgi:general nucleoside transport system permease protein